MRGSQLSPVLRFGVVGPAPTPASKPGTSVLTCLCVWVTRLVSLGRRIGAAGGLTSVRPACRAARRQEKSVEFVTFHALTLQRSRRPSAGPKRPPRASEAPLDRDSAHTDPQASHGCAGQTAQSKRGPSEARE